MQSTPLLLSLSDPLRSGETGHDMVLSMDQIKPFDL